MPNTINPIIDWTLTPCQALPRSVAIPWDLMRTTDSPQAPSPAPLNQNGGGGVPLLCFHKPTWWCWHAFKFADHQPRCWRNREYKVHIHTAAHSVCRNQCTPVLFYIVWWRPPESYWLSHVCATSGSQNHSLQKDGRSETQESQIPPRS